MWKPKLIVTDYNHGHTIYTTTYTYIQEDVWMASFECNTVSLCPKCGRCMEDYLAHTDCRSRYFTLAEIKEDAIFSGPYVVFDMIGLDYETISGPWTYEMFRKLV